MMEDHFQIFLQSTVFKLYLKKCIWLVGVDRTIQQSLCFVTHVFAADCVLLVLDELLLLAE